MLTRLGRRCITQQAQEGELAEIKELQAQTKNELAAGLATALQRQQQGHQRMQQQLKAQLNATHAALERATQERERLALQVQEEASALAKTRQDAACKSAELNTTCCALQARLNSTWSELQQVSADRSRLEAQVRELEGKVLMFAPLAAAQQAVRLCQASCSGPAPAAPDAADVAPACRNESLKATNCSDGAAAQAVSVHQTLAAEAGRQDGHAQKGSFPSLSSTGETSIDSLASDMRRLMQHLSTLLPDSNGSQEVPGAGLREEKGKKTVGRTAKTLIALAGGGSGDSARRQSILKPGSGRTPTTVLVERRLADDAGDCDCDAEAHRRRGGWLACFGFER